MQTPSEAAILGEQNSELGAVNHWQIGMAQMKRQKLGDGRDRLKQLLIECARALSRNAMDEFEVLVEEARASVSINGEPIQRLGAYVIEGLVARKEASGLNIFRSLRWTGSERRDLLWYLDKLYNACPYIKFVYLAASGAIADACRDENIIHVIDFRIVTGLQWLPLFRALASRPGGPPLVRITAVEDPLSRSSLPAALKTFTDISRRFSIPLQFCGVPVSANDVTKEMLDVHPGEVVVVNLAMQLHKISDESVDVRNRRDELLRMVKSLCPKVTTLIELESNTNTSPFFSRFVEALDLYSAMFDSIDGILSRGSEGRLFLEQHLLAATIVNIIACEDKERTERCELFGKWKARFTMAGFRQYPLNSYINSVIRTLLCLYSDHYTLVERDGALLLGWKSRNIASASAWY